MSTMESRTATAVGQLLEKSMASEGRSEARIVEFCQWLLRMSRCDEVELIIAFILLDRLYASKLFKVNKTPFWRQRLIVCALCIAVKVRRDKVLPNTVYSNLLSLPVAEFNDLERAFLEIVQFDVFVSRSDYHMYRAALLNPEAARKSPVAEHTQEDSPCRGHKRSRSQSSKTSPRVSALPRPAFTDSAEPSAEPPAKRVRR
ncbi:CYC2-like cyclin 6 [Diplonema papillatum]|nr:CYC2-like cyclin 6 [Diplonema papillatum]